MPHFECGAFDHSATSPVTLVGACWRGLSHSGNSPPTQERYDAFSTLLRKQRRPPLRAASCRDPVCEFNATPSLTNGGKGPSRIPDESNCKALVTSVLCKRVDKSKSKIRGSTPETPAILILNAGEGRATPLKMNELPTRTWQPSPSPQATSGKPPISLSSVTGYSRTRTPVAL